MDSKKYGFVENDFKLLTINEKESTRSAWRKLLCKRISSFD